MKLKQKSWVITGVLAAGLIAAVAGHGGWFGWIGFVLILTGLLLKAAWFRRPNCGVWLGKYPGKYCRSCGEKIPWEE